MIFIARAATQMQTTGRSSVKKFCDITASLSMRIRFRSSEMGSVRISTIHRFDLLFSLAFPRLLA